MIYVFDIDGTLTQPGCDIFFNVMKDVVPPRVFSDALKIFEASGVTSESSMQLVNAFLNALSPDIDSQTLYQRTYSYCEKVFPYVREQAIQTLSDINLNDGSQIIFSTANLTNSAVGFIHMLKNKGVVPDSIKIALLGTEVDWRRRLVTHMNVGPGKVASLKQYLNLADKDISERVVFYCDDIKGNDKELSEMASATKLITTPSNAHLACPTNMERLSW